MTQASAESSISTLDPTLVAQLQQVLSRVEDLELAIVFGSAAAGRLRFDSNLDIALKLGHPMSVSEKITLIEALAENTGRPIDLVDLYDPPEPLLGQILQHGYRLLGSQTEYVNLLSRHLVEQADFMPLVNRMLKERREAWLRKIDSEKNISNES
jgi:predicted nucleotidyltransferase